MKFSLRAFLWGALSALILLIGVYFLPPVHRRLAWRVDAARTTLRMMLHPVAPAPPTPVEATPMATTTPAATPSATLSPTITPTPTPGPTATPTPSPTPIPPQVQLTPPKWEAQDWNNCGPDTLALYLRWWGWEGDQYDISRVLKPERGDRNVNVEELVGFVNTRIPGFSAVYRVGGNLETLKRVLASGMPVMIEESMMFEEQYWPHDDRWAAHYLLITGYDDTKEVFITQDSFRGPNLPVSYQTLEHNWEPFNNVYILVFPNARTDQVKALLGEDWDTDVNRRKALAWAKEATEKHPDDAFAWFNLGTNLLYFERYGEAARAYDQALRLGLPQRFLRYQFGPFIAYFHTGRFQDLLALTEYALKITPNSEEAHLWRGWAYYRLGERQKAIEEFRAALEANPHYEDAKYALQFVGARP
ncbi:MAG: tetratricopeptide repeat protein [Chloroflexi bacterium]|nr:tetratricopeptide repeat protein [Chloroflexota bacterium]